MVLGVYILSLEANEFYRIDSGMNQGCRVFVYFYCVYRCHNKRSETRDENFFQIVFGGRERMEIIWPLACR